MKLALVHLPAAACPYRLLDDTGRQIAWANDFLDAQHIRQLSPRSLRAYAYDLLHFARWFQDQHQTLSSITESTLRDYVRHQLNQQPRPTPQTINHRLTVVRCLYRFHHGQEIPAGHSHFQRTYMTRTPLGWGRPRKAIAHGLRLRQPHRVVIPLSTEEIAKFWGSFRTFRDLALVGVMLLDGLRSCEVLELRLEDLQLAQPQLCVPGKGNKKRILPLAGELVEVFQNYLRLERPLLNSPYLFVSLKGRHRGQQPPRSVVTWVIHDARGPQETLHHLPPLVPSRSTSRRPPTSVPSAGMSGGVAAEDAGQLAAPQSGLRPRLETGPAQGSDPVAGTATFAAAVAATSLGCGERRVRRARR